MPFLPSRSSQAQGRDTSRIWNPQRRALFLFYSLVNPQCLADNRYPMSIIWRSERKSIISDKGNPVGCWNTEEQPEVVREIFLELVLRNEGGGEVGEAEGCEVGRAFSKEGIFKSTGVIRGYEQLYVVKVESKGQEWQCLKLEECI